MNYLLEVLQGGDLRSDGHADEVAGDVIQDPALFPLLLHIFEFVPLLGDILIITGTSPYNVMSVLRGSRNCCRV
ncbi:MAG: hypothetical protein HVN34_00525 [Methanobacteriaceae archaeon]|jgi:hypothetical protein|nr:hypothetical protein [Methanobacteriaceae archaeon]OPX57595.1 MAG: hypothetical protein A4E25_02186 [Methanobacterium sp. PtaB.Bin024]